MGRRGLPAWIALAATLVAASDLSGQLEVGAHVARAPDLFGGTPGFGLRAGVRVGPLGAVAVGDWYGVDCPAEVGDCHYRSGTLLATVDLPGPVIHPYVLAGVGLRDLAPGPGTSERTSVLGFGLRLDLGPAGVFGEVAGEVGDRGPTQLVFRMGALF